MNIGAQNLCTVKSLHITYDLDVVYTVPPYLQFASTDSTKHELCNIVILTTEKKKKTITSNWTNPIQTSVVQGSSGQNANIHSSCQILIRKREF